MSVGPCRDGGRGPWDRRPSRGITVPGVPCGEVVGRAWMLRCRARRVRVCVCTRVSARVCACARACTSMLKCARTYLHTGVHVARIRIYTYVRVSLHLQPSQRALGPQTQILGCKERDEGEVGELCPCTPTHVHTHTHTHTLVPPSARGHPQGRPGCWGITRTPVVGSGWRCPPLCLPHLGGRSRLGAMGYWPVPQFGDPVAPAVGPQGQDLR